jgi:hypothetical protein
VSDFPYGIETDASIPPGFIELRDTRGEFPTVCWIETTEGWQEIEGEQEDA